MNVFITGGTSGIGLALARRYAGRGCRVGVLALPGTEPEGTAAGGLAGVVRYEGDVRDAAALRQAVETFAGGRLDLLIASAGINQGFAPREHPDVALERTVIEVNLLGVLNAFGAALPLMVRAKRGQLAAIASASGLFGVPGNAGYTASKAAVINLCEAYAVELARHGVHVACFAPGFVDTPLMAGNPERMPCLLSPDQAAERIAEALERRREWLVFPRPIAVAAQCLRLLPRAWYRALFRRAYDRRMRRLRAGDAASP